jgi:tetratricopeptide (TPR) repeat protein
VALGEVDRAIETVESTERIVIEHIGRLIGYAYLGNGFAEAYLAKAEQSTGEERLTWLKKTRPILRRTLMEAGHVRMVLPDAQMFQGRYEWLSGRRNKALEWWKRALAQAESTGLRFNQGVIHLEIGRHLGDQEHLQQAVMILDEIGAKHDLAQAREALM